MPIELQATQSSQDKSLKALLKSLYCKDDHKKQADEKMKIVKTDQGKIRREIAIGFPSISHLHEVVEFI